MCQSLAPYGATGIDAQSIPMRQVLSFLMVLYAAWVLIKKTSPCGAVIFAIFTMENSKKLSHYDPHIKTVNHLD